MNRRSFLVALAGVAAAPHLLEGIRYNPRVIPRIHDGDTQIRGQYGPGFRVGDRVSVGGEVYRVTAVSGDGDSGCITLDRPIVWRMRSIMLTPAEVFRVFG